VKRRAIVLIALATTILSACVPEEPTQPLTLRSGKVVPLLDARRVEKDFYIEYCSEGPQHDRDALRPEVAEVVETFRSELIDPTEVHIGPTDCHLEILWAGWWPVFVRNRSTWFRFVRDANGKWVGWN
jgi:hypothetical protein